MHSTDVYVFGDQSTPVLERLQGLLYVKDNSTLSSFLNDAFLVVQTETEALSSYDRSTITQAENLGLLLKEVRRISPHAALDSSFLVIYEVGYYINYLSETRKQHPPAIPSYFLGLCTGGLAAAAISCAENVFEISRLGLQAVAVAFRQGMHIRKLAEFLGSWTSASWSLVVSPADEEAVSAALLSFSAQKKLLAALQPYCSAVGPGFVTISGPPSILESVKLLPELSCKRQYAAPIYGPYHSPQAYSEKDLDKIETEVLRDVDFADNEVHVPLLSCASSSLLDGTRFRGLLESVLKSAIAEPIRMDRVIDGLFVLAKEQTISIIPISTHVASSLADALSQRGAAARVQHQHQLQDAAEKTSSTTTNMAAPDRSKIAIIGFSGRFPEADDLDDFWELLLRGRDVHKIIPETRFTRDHFDPTGQRKNTSKFFHMSPKEAAQTDPAQRLALMTAYEALEMGGFVPDRTPSTRQHRVGVYYGTTSNDWGEVNSAQAIDTYYIPGANRAFIPGRINYFFKFSGPSIAVDTACSSSLAAIDLAVTALLRGDCDSAVAGGTNVLTNPDNFAGLDRGHFLSRTGNCKTFEDGADGYCRADGIGTLVLKRLPDALADGDPIFGVLLGSHTNHSAESVSITRPLADAQEYLFQKLLGETGIHPHDVSYVEMHGTGTQAGDAVEMRSVLSAFAPDTRRRPDQPLYLGSVKANVGHAESASGVIAVIKVLLMLQKNKIPPHCGIKTKLNRNFPADLDQRSVRIAQGSAIDWPRPAGGVRRVLINNFSAAGGNTSLLLQDGPLSICAPEQKQKQKQKQQSHHHSHVITVSARSAKALKDSLHTLESFLASTRARSGVDADTDAGTDSDANLLAQLSYTMTARRMHHSHRAAFVASSVDGLQRALSAAAATATAADIPPVPKTAPRVCFLFTGQGAQETAMARGYFTRSASFRADIEAFDAVGRRQGLPSVLPLVDGSAAAVQELSTVVVQLGTCIVQMALARFWVARLGVEPACVIGHSLGEYAAMQAAGILSVHDTIFLCGHRAQLLADRCSAGTHGMVAVKGAATTADVLQKKHLTGAVEVACFNGVHDTVLSGPRAELDAVCSTLMTTTTTTAELGPKLQLHRLEVPYAYHSSQVDPVLDELEALAAHVTFHKPSSKIAMVSSLLGKVVSSSSSSSDDDDEIIGPEYIRRHAREPVNFLGALQAAVSAGLLHPTKTACIEIGAHPVLTRMSKDVAGQALCVCASARRQEENAFTLANALAALYLAGLPICWDAHQRDDNEAAAAGCHRVLTTLPCYSWQLANHWMQYQHSWCLTKGDAPGPEIFGTEALPPASPAPLRHITRLSDSVHDVVELAVGDDQSSIAIQSDMHDAALIVVAKNHRVNGLTMAPSSLFSDIAFTMAKHLIEKRGLDPATHMPAINDMSVEKALIVNETGPQLFGASLTIDWATLRGPVQIYSIGAGGKKSPHGSCEIVIEDPQTYQNRWQSYQYLIDRSIQQLTAGDGDDRPAHILRRGMLYKLFSASVQYGDPFQGIQKVWFDSSSSLEATADVFLPPKTTGQRDDRFYLDPYCCDSLGHLTGFLMNCCDSLDLEEHVYVNHGWSALHLAEPYQTGVRYQTHVKMRATSTDDDSAYSGDVHVLRDGNIIAVCENVSFRKVSRKVLEMLLPRPKPGSSKEIHNNNKEMLETENLRPTASVAAAPVPSSPEPSAAGADLLQKALSIVAEEIDVAVAALTDATQLADLGVDSLMSLTILGSFREELDLDIPSAKFHELVSVKDLKDFIADFAGLAVAVAVAVSDDISVSSSSDCSATTATNIPSTSATTPATTSSTNLTTVDMASKPATHSPRSRKEVPSSTSTILQGTKHCSKTLFLFPDGAGSATSYAALPRIAAELRVVGLNSPYLTKPHEFTCPLQDVTASYLREVRRRQPFGTGPYHLAGWSAGGVSAFDAARQLVAEGEVVETLILIDSPNPVGLGKLPKRMYDFLQKCGIFGGLGDSLGDELRPQAPPDWLFKHFCVFIEALDRYEPTPFAPGTAPQTTIIWARDGVCKHPDDPRPEAQLDDPRGMTWLLYNRSDFGPNGWDEFIDADQISTVAVDNANHFSMMREPVSSQLCALIRDAVKCE